MRPSSAWAPTPQAVLSNAGLAVPAVAGLRRRRCRPSVGVVVGVPALRVKGIYLGIATLAFGFIVEEVPGALGIGHRRQCRHARQGPDSSSAGRCDSSTEFYFLCLAIAVLAHRWPS